MSHFDISKLQKDLKDLEAKTLDSEFWNDQKNSQKILEKIKSIKRKCNKYEEIEKEINNLKELSELVNLEPDEEIAKDIIVGTNKIKKD